MEGLKSTIVRGTCIVCIGFKCSIPPWGFQGYKNPVKIYLGLRKSSSQILPVLGKFSFYLFDKWLASGPYWASENENVLAPQEILLVLDGTFFEPWFPQHKTPRSTHTLYLIYLFISTTPQWDASPLQGLQKWWRHKWHTMHAEVMTFNNALAILDIAKQTNKIMYSRR